MTVYDGTAESAIRGAHAVAPVLIRGAVKGEAGGGGFSGLQFLGVHAVGGIRDDLFLLGGGQIVVMVQLHVEGAETLGHGGKVGPVGEHLG
jgi:hypothetical protein